MEDSIQAPISFKFSENAALPAQSSRCYSRPPFQAVEKEPFMAMRLSSPSMFILGSALVMMSAASAFAQTESAPNPFGGTLAQATPAPSAPAPKKPRSTALKAGQFANEADAKTSCPDDTVVWVNTGTKVYHHAGAKSYGKTKRGAYMCEKDTAAAGYRAAKREKG
jgi:hypothetical protein